MWKKGKEYKYGEKGYGTAKEQRSWASHDRKMARIKSQNEERFKKYPESHYENVGRISKNAPQYHSFGAGFTPKEVKESLSKHKSAKYIAIKKALEKAEK